MTLSSEEFSILRLIRTPSIGPQTFWKLHHKFSSAQSIIDHWPEVKSILKRPLPLIHETQVMEEVEQTLKKRAGFLFYKDNRYPVCLLENSDRPPVLTFQGQIDLLKQKKIAIVGARNASSHGCKMAYGMAKDMGEKGWSVVSGLARGIDSAAHQGSLKTGTIAILGNGINTIYPEENKNIQSEIAEKGLLLSEFPFGAEPHVGHFPKRNRLIAALARGIVVIEAAYQSGSLLTAQYGLEKGKDIFAVPGSPMDPRCRGSNRLIKQGAVLTESAMDVLEVLDSAEWLALYKNRTTIRKSEKISPLEPDSLLSHLSVIPLSIDELAERSQLSLAQLSAALTDLELGGQITKHPGNKVSLTLQG